MLINTNIARMPGSYLFQEIAGRLTKYEENRIGRKLIRLGIGDVTMPLPKYIAEKFAEAALNMSTKEGFKGYPPGSGYSFLINKIIEHDYLARGVKLDEDEVFISDGA